MKAWKIVALLLSAILFFVTFALLQSQNNNLYDIIIVGTGLAGLTAAHEAYKITEGQLKILLLESQSTFGGNSKKATSGINLIKTQTQAKNNITDGYSIFYNDTKKSSGDTADEHLIDTLVQNSELFFEFFAKMDINLSNVAILGGHSKARTHRPDKGTIGYTLTSNLFERIAHSTNVEIQFNTKVTKILISHDEKKIIGVEVETGNEKRRILGKTVILATGGYAYDFFSSNSLIKEFVPELFNLPTTNGIGSQGNGMKMARSIGAKLVDMDKVQVHPTGFVNLKERISKTKVLAPELLRGVGGILINQKGKRFANELGRRDYVTKMIMDNCDKYKETINGQSYEQYEAFLILNQKGVDNYGSDIQFYINKGFLMKFENVDSLSEKFGINVENLKETLKGYNSHKSAQKDEFGKEIFDLKFKEDETLYIGIVTPSLHYTMGGVKINEYAEVINAYSGNIIEGLYAAGEVTGGIHGQNRLGGNSLLDCAVFGKKAAESAVEYLEY